MADPESVKDTVHSAATARMASFGTSSRQPMSRNFFPAAGVQMVEPEAENVADLNTAGVRCISSEAPLCNSGAVRTITSRPPLD